MLGKLLAPLGAILILAAATIVAAPMYKASATTPLSPEEEAFLTLINSYREQNRRGKLNIDTKLQDASEWMSIDMGVNAYFSHTDSLGRDVSTRLGAFGYSYNTWKGENLAAGTSSAQTAFNLWKDSPGHNSNMLNSNYTAIGIARRYTAGSPYGWYWTTDFGGYLSSPLPPQSSATPTPFPGGDSDGDGFTNAVESAVGSSPDLSCGNPDTTKPGWPSLNWPADLVAGASANRVDIQDLTSFLGPVRRLGTSPGDSGYDARWDLVPGRGSFSATINVTDMTMLLTVAPPMFSGQRAFGGPACQ